jgi:hypothetical protein
VNAPSAAAGPGVHGCYACAPAMPPLPLAVAHYGRHDPTTHVGGVETFARNLRFVLEGGGDQAPGLQERQPAVALIEDHGEQWHAQHPAERRTEAIGGAALVDRIGGEGAGHGQRRTQVGQGIGLAERRHAGHRAAHGGEAHHGGRFGCVGHFVRAERSHRRHLGIKPCCVVWLREQKVIGHL